ncbi:MAG TPA: YciI family protein [Candidatus Baltobacteraceae bacterium]|jgi:hypothetical protein|nr:YciI family protein [Candidatus Baltobacteraceae bacterium]
MWYIVMAYDGPNTAGKRSEHYPSHKAHVRKADEYGVAVFLSGPLVGDDGLSPVGSLFVIEAGNRGDVEEFNREDPFSLYGVWCTSTISGFIRKR